MYVCTLKDLTKKTYIDSLSALDKTSDIFSAIHYFRYMIMPVTSDIYPRYCPFALKVKIYKW
jgi:hypothetical protein